MRQIFKMLYFFQNDSKIGYHHSKTSFCTYIVSNTHNTAARNDFIDIILSFKLWILYTVISIIANHESIFLEMLHLGKFYW